MYLQKYSLKNLKNVNFLYDFRTRFNIACILMRFYLPILEYRMEGTMSQILYLGPRFYFMKCKR